MQSNEAPAAEETRLETKNVAMEQAKSFISGGFGGACAVLVGASYPHHSRKFYLGLIDRFGG